MATKRRQSELRNILYREIASVCLGIELPEQKAKEKKIPTPLSAEESLQFLAFDVVYEKELPIVAKLCNDLGKMGYLWVGFHGLRCELGSKGRSLYPNFASFRLFGPKKASIHPKVTTKEP
jgi:hypothetical protein